MDSRARLDYALFQLTPTRTRCDLVVFSGGRTEKLASGLLDPFISHLRCAKEQISKGGYSITLRPPVANAPWFTKGTLERFVRFVSTPEVLERFVTIEREILQIEISIQSNESSNAIVPGHTEEGGADVNANKSVVLYKPKEVSKDSDEATRGENSKLRLQRVLETRKVVLRKEQAMAYARSYVAGFEMERIDELICFSDAFGASRLREACVDFKELCYKKHNDGLWMDELAAVQAFPQPELPYVGTSGIILTSQLDRNGSLDASDSITNNASSDINQGQPPTNANSQFPMSWANHPQFMYPFQRPGQQMPQYQGYPYPGMHPPYYQQNMQWSPNIDESGHGNHRRNRKSSTRRNRSPNGRRSEGSDQDEQTEPSDSNPDSDEEAQSQNDHKHSPMDQPRKKRNGKKSSRTVVIRNINYITSKRKDGDEDTASDESSSGEDEFLDGDSLRQKVKDAVGSLDKHHKSTSRRSKRKGGKKNHTTQNEANGSADNDLDDDPVGNNSEGGKTNGNWESFQNLLMRDDKLGPSEVEQQHGVDVRDEYFAIKNSESGPSFGNGYAVDPESEKGTKQRMMATDSFIVNGRYAGNEGNNHLGNFESSGSARPSMGRRDSTNEEMLFSQRTGDSERNDYDSLAGCNNESSVLRTQKGEDWYVVSQPDKQFGTDATRVSSIFDGDLSLKLEGESKKDDFGDDSFMVQNRSVDDQPDSQWRTDMSMMPDLTASQEEVNTPDLSADKVRVSGNYEPDDLCMVLERTLGAEPDGASWTPQMDHEIDISYAEFNNRHSGVQPDELIEEKPPSNGKLSNGKKPSAKETKSKPREPLWKSKHEVITRAKKPSSVSRPAVHKSKAEMEEETRKRMEELVIQRQKRIAERSSTRGSTPKTSPIESKTAITKQTSRPTAQETKRLSLPKPGITSSAIDRLASAQVKQKGSSPPPSKSTPPKKVSSKINGSTATSLSPKLSTVESKKKPGSDQVKLSQNSVDHQEVTCSEPNPVNGTPFPHPNVEDQAGVSKTQPQIRPNVPQIAHILKGHATESLMESCDPTIIRNEQDNTSNVVLDVKRCDQNSLNSSKIEDDYMGTSKPTPVLHRENLADQGSQINGFNSVKMEDDLPKHTGSTTNHKLSVPSEISQTEIVPDEDESAPSLPTEMNVDTTPSRRKWTTPEGSPPAAKGLKKLLLFGRKSSSPVSS